MVTRLVLITGAPGVGKTSVAQCLAANLGGTVARLCGDVFILAVTPFAISDDRRLFLRRNLTSFARHAMEHDFDWVVVECVIPSDEFIRDLIAAIGLPESRVRVFSLVASQGVYKKRLETKIRYHQAATLNLDECYEWMERIRRLELPTLIDTSRNSAEDTTEKILRLLGE
jgi:2-phosphoglycerate kinase